jgi:type VI secretion system protein ImpI
MGLGLVLTITNTESSEVTSHRIERPSALLGRDSQMCDCVLDDRHVSKLHASVEIREGQFFVRDASSTNGTLVHGQRVPSNAWTSLGPASQDQEFTISKWRISVHAQAVEERSGALSIGLASLAIDAPNARDLGAGTYAMNHPLDSLAGVYADHVALIAKIHGAIRRSLEAAPPSAREFIAQEAAARFPLLMHHAEFHTLLNQYGAKLVLTPDRAALLALQDLARAHVDPARVVTTPREIALFATNITMTLGTLFSGTMQLFSGMREFEHQLDLGPEQSVATMMPASRRPTSPAELSRALLDWRERTEPALDLLRRRFNSLMVHQVAMLNGVMRGVKVLLTELAPKTLVKMLARGSGKGGKLRRFMSWFLPSRALWSLFSERYADLADEENERFRLLFGPEFASEYRQLSAEAAGGRGHGQTRGPGGAPPR